MSLWIRRYPLRTHRRLWSGSHPLHRLLTRTDFSPQIGLPPVIHFGSDELKAKIVGPCLRAEKRICLAITEVSPLDVHGRSCTDDPRSLLEDPTSPTSSRLLSRLQMASTTSSTERRSGLLAESPPYVLRRSSIYSTDGSRYRTTSSLLFERAVREWEASLSWSSRTPRESRRRR